MKQISIPAVGHPVSRIGFGCASFGSRVSASEGRYALERAISAGVTWFDVAPPYGDGNAELLLGKALQGRRASVSICTKFGIPRPQISLKHRLLRPVARGAVKLMPSLRKAAGRVRGEVVHTPIVPDMIVPSLMESLKRLQTDYVDVLAIHEPTPEEAVNPEIFEVLAKLKAEGRIRAIGIAGSRECIQAAMGAGMPLDVAQFPAEPLQHLGCDPFIAQLQAQGISVVTHSIFSIGQSLLSATGDLSQKIASILQKYGLPQNSPAGMMLLSLALAANSNGVVITSMYKERHILQNAALVGDSVPEGIFEEFSVLAKHVF